jgi:site-specific recombinase XerD
MDSMHERYDQALDYSHDKNLPPEAPRPCPTQDWPPENVTLLEHYGDWLAGGGASENVIRTISIPMAGHVMGLALKPYPQLDLDEDLLPALEYVKAKGAGPDWSDVCRNSLEKFRRFLLNERGQLESKIKHFNVARHTQGLPGWLVQELERFQHIRQRNWRTARLENSIYRYWCGCLRTWRFLVERCGVKELADLRRPQLYDYAADRLKSGHAASGVNGDLREFHSFMLFLQDQGYAVPQSLFHVPGLKQPDRLPKYLTDEQVRLLRDDCEEQVRQAKFAYQKRDAMLYRACFYLLWQSGLRRGEVEELRLEDLDLAGRKLTVRRGKGLIDRTVFLTNTGLDALRSYLAVRGMGPTDHVFLYRNQPLSKDLIHGRLKMAGERVGVKVYAHRLRHTCATQLINAGCRVTSIQKFLGHKKLNSTMIYARVYDKTVAEDYYTAMNEVEKRLELIEEPEGNDAPVSENERTELLKLADRLAEPELDLGMRMELVLLMRGLLNGKELAPKKSRKDDLGIAQWDHQPPSAALIEADIA